MRDREELLPFLRRGFEVTGCDVSPAMLAEAARKAPDAVWSRRTCARCPCSGEFDLVICFDDSLNHLLDEADLAAALRSMARTSRRRACCCST